MEVELHAVEAHVVGARGTVAEAGDPAADGHAAGADPLLNGAA